MTLSSTYRDHKIIKFHPEPFTEARSRYLTIEKFYFKERMYNHLRTLERLEALANTCEDVFVSGDDLIVLEIYEKLNAPC